MKRKFYCFLALFTAVAMICACDDQIKPEDDGKQDETETPENPENPGENEGQTPGPEADAITVSDAFASPYEVPAAGEVVEVEVVANGAWTAVSDVEFVTVDPAQGDAGTATVTVTVAENVAYEAREAQVVFTCGEASVTVAVSQAAAEKPQATDLSAAATANCYTVPAAGLYKIKTVKGNSAESVGEVASAELVWSYSTFGGMNAVVAPEVTYEDGYITFSTTGTDGNALIAAKDAAGNILWSWHIWAIREIPEIQIGGITAQAYSLGYVAWPDNDAYSWGLLYQWGRKDPFGIKWAIPIDPADVFMTSVSVADASGGDGTSLDYSIAHPTHFIKGNDTTCDWYAAEGANQNNGLWAAAKTIYDPCPAGYLVASPELYKGIDATKITFETNDTRHAMVYEGNDFYYSGYINYNKNWEGWEYSGGWFWSNAVVDGSAFATSAYILGGIDPAKGWYRGTAMAVRCVKE
ncbi:MAG: BACON domain-containing protein [Bacteroidales bacterium]|nr:BACON domain-containing protein [Bacteroidales bacterium]